MRNEQRRFIGHRHAMRLIDRAWGWSAGAIVLLVLGGCAAAGPRTEGMSIAEHEIAARREATIAAAQQRLYDPNAGFYSSPCGEFCFVTWTNPTFEHARAARRARRRARYHWDAAEELREEVQEACEGIPPRDRDISPFSHYGDVVAVTVDDEEDAMPSELTLRFRAIPGVDADKMQDLVDCHLARNAARGHVAPELADCPLVPRGVSADVDPERDELAIHIEVDDPQSRPEVWTRVQRLMERTADRRRPDRA